MEYYIDGPNAVENNDDGVLTIRLVGPEGYARMEVTTTELKMLLAKWSPNDLK